MTNEETLKCNGIIHTASVAAAGIGAANPFPLGDTVPITGFQVTMIIELGQVFDITLTEAMAKSAVSGWALSIFGRSLAQVVASFFPGGGNAVNAATAAALTEAIGWGMANQFDKERGKTFYAI